MKTFFMLILALVASQVWAVPLDVKEDFSSYPQGAEPTPLWATRDIYWSAEQGQLLCKAAGERSFCLLSAPAGYRELAFEAQITPLESSGEGWKIAGIALYQSDANFWHLAFVESPKAEGARHFIELSESLEGVWLSQVNLRERPGFGSDYNWQYGQTYRFRLEVTPEGITAVVSTQAGQEVTRLGHDFNAEAVTWGKPAFDASGIRALFDDARAEGRDEVMPRPQEPKSYPPVDVPTLPQVKREGTGFFTVAEQDGRWWCFAPSGEAYFALGTDHCRYSGHWCEKLGYAPYERNNDAKYSSREEWYQQTLGRLKQWNFNLLSAGADVPLRYQGLAHVEFISFGAAFSDYDPLVIKTTWTGFPNVFSPDWARYCDKRAQQTCEQAKDDPWLFGYFLDNELEWYGKTYREEALFDEGAKLPADNPAKQALVEQLRAKYGQIEALNEAWGSQFASWEDVLGRTELSGPRADAVLKDKLAYVDLVAELYFKGACEAIRKHDPNHMIIGSRFAGNAPDAAWRACGRYSDIVTFNYYPTLDFESGAAPELAETWRHYHELCGGKPMMLTEWSFPALDSGLPCMHGAGMRVDTQEQKAKCYEVFQKTLFSLPFMVGSDYFMWVDEPALGISSTFPEDSNYGLVNEQDEPYVTLTDTATRVNAMAYGLHSGQAPALSVRFEGEGAEAACIVENQGGVAVTTDCAYWVDGAEERRLSLQIPAQSSAQLAIKLPAGPGGHCARVVVDPGATLPEANRADNTASHAWTEPEQPFAALKGQPVLKLVVSNPELAAVLKPLASVELPAAFAKPGAAFLADGSPVTAQFVPGELPLLWLQLEELAACSAKTIYWAPGAKSAVTPAADLRINDTGTQLSIEQGALRCSFQQGAGPMMRLYWEGQELGFYQGVIQQRNPANAWPGTNAVVGYELAEGPLMTQVTVTGAYTPAEGSSERAYETRHRFTFFAGQPGCLVELVDVTNTDERPLTLVAIFEYLLPNLGGSREGDEVWGPGVPQYYKSVFGWEDKTAGLAEVLLPTPRSELKGYFWKDKNDNSFHADARVELATPVELAPGASYNVSGGSALLLGGSTAALSGAGLEVPSPLQVLANLVED